MGDTFEMNHLLKHTVSTISVLLLSTSLSWGGALDGKGVFCIGIRGEPNDYGTHFALKFRDSRVEEYIYEAISDKIVFRRTMTLSSTEYRLNPDTISWVDKKGDLISVLDRKSLKLFSAFSRQDAIANCRVAANTSEFNAEAEKLTRKFQSIYDENTKDNKL